MAAAGWVWRALAVVAAGIKGIGRFNHLKVEADKFLATVRAEREQRRVPFRLRGALRSAQPVRAGWQQSALTFESANAILAKR